MGWLDLLAPALLGVVVVGRRKLGAAAVTGVAAGLWGSFSSSPPRWPRPCRFSPDYGFATAELRVAVVSDIHSNLHALEAVLAAIGRRRRRDLVPRRPRRLRSAAERVLRGGGRTGRLAWPETTTSACSGRSRWPTSAGEGAAAVPGRATSSSEARGLLGGLAPKATAEGVELYHCESAGPGLGVRPRDEAALARSRRRRAARARRPQPRAARRSAVRGRRSEGRPHGRRAGSSWRTKRWLFNPGSVGQPREGDPRAAYLMLDLDAESATLPPGRVRRREDAVARSATRAAGALAARLALGSSAASGRGASAARAPARDRFRIGDRGDGEGGGVEDLHALARECELDVLAGLPDPPLDGRERHLERVGDLAVERPTTSRSRSAIFRSTLSRSTARQTASIVSRRSNGRSSDLERRDVVEIDDGPRTALGRPELVEDAVLRRLEEPGRELRAVREAREALEDTEEDLLREVLGERPVADHAQDIVVDRELVGADDNREGAFIASLRLPQDAVIGLGQRQGAAV